MTKLIRSIQASTSRFQRNRSNIWILLPYIALSAVMTWPLISTLGERIPAGIGGDVWANQWAHWWVKHSLFNGENPFLTTMLYYPDGVSLATYNIPWVNIALWLPLQAIIGNYAAYSILYVAIFAFNCFAMYLLVYELNQSLSAALIAGLIFGFFPYVVSRNGQPNWIFVSWLPLALLYLKRTIENGRIRDAIISGIFIALIGVTLWHLLILSALVIVIFLLFLYWNDRSVYSRGTFLLLGISAVVALILILPLALPVITELLTAENRQDYLLSNEVIKSTNLLAYIVPNGNLILWSKLVAYLPERMQFTNERIEFVGLMVILLASIGSVAYWKKAWPWFLLLIILIAFALGPILQVGDYQFKQFPLPYRYLEDSFLLRILRHSNRFNVVLGLPLSLLAALGIVKLGQTQFTRKKPLLLTVAIGLIILAEYMQIPYQTTETEIPDWYQQLAQEEEEFAILDLPMQPNGTDKEFMRYQMVHEKPLVGGHVSRLNRDAYTFIDESAILSSLSKDNSFGTSNVDVSHQLNALADSGVKYIILHKQFVTEDKIKEWKDWLTGASYYEDDDLVVYRTDLFQEGQLEFEHKLTKDIGLIDVSYWPEQIEQTDPISFKLRWGASHRPINDYEACIQLINDDKKASQDDCSAIPKEWPTRNWQKNEVVRGDFDLRIDPFLEPGNYSVNLILMNEDQEAGKPVLLGTIKVDARPRVFEIEESPIPVDAIWTNNISLIGYESSQDDETLQLKLYWQALRRIDKSYKYFIHIIDPASDQVVAQVDALPQNWTYPTDWWEKGEIVIDPVSLPLSEVGPESYRLQIGFYDELSGERLSARSASGQLYADDVVILSNIEHP